MIRGAEGGGVWVLRRGEEMGRKERKRKAAFPQAAVVGFSSQNSGPLAAVPPGFLTAGLPSAFSALSLSNLPEICEHAVSFCKVLVFLFMQVLHISGLAPSSFSPLIPSPSFYSPLLAYSVCSEIFLFLSGIIMPLVDSILGFFFFFSVLVGFF